ncbi:MAG: multidrug resistance efflux pump [Mariniblastus sp.]|jgi:multidrug resistance efflux pump
MITNRVRNRFSALVPSNKRTAAIHLVQSSRFARRLAKWLLVGLVASITGMAFLPWQQTSRGTGQVIAFAPQERQQSVQAPLKGVVIRIKEGLFEGAQVKKGDFLLQIQPFAPEMILQLEQQVRELQAKENASNAKAEAYGLNVAGYTDAREFAVSAAKEMVSAAEAKLESQGKKVDGFRAKKLQARLNYDRQEGLFQKGIKAAKEIEKFKKELDVSEAEFESGLQDVLGLKNELKAKQEELEEKRSLASTKIESARAMQQDALSSASSIRKDIVDLEMKQKEIDRGTVKAPRDGTVFRLNVNELGATIKEGDNLLTLIPETSQKAVELYVNGNDMPLLKLGQEVRLQFEGWPAVQFAGWPSVAVGTFSGSVATVDATDNGKGEFRILITPNENQQEWPSDRYLRQGVRANGWVMLRRVSLGYEIWRQLNGFPVIVAESEPKKDKVKTPKLPK